MATECFGFAGVEADGLAGELEAPVPDSAMRT